MKVSEFNVIDQRIIRLRRKGYHSDEVSKILNEENRISPRGSEITGGYVTGRVSAINPNLNNPLTKIMKPRGINPSDIMSVNGNGVTRTRAAKVTNADLVKNILVDGTLNDHRKVSMLKSYYEI